MFPGVREAPRLMFLGFVWAVDTQNVEKIRVKTMVIVAIEVNIIGKFFYSNFIQREREMSTLEYWVNTLTKKAKELLSDIELDTWTKYGIEKLKQSFELIINMSASLVKRVDDVFPPEERAEIIGKLVHMAKPYLKPGLALLFIILFFCYCGRSGGGAGKMMKAPGRNVRIPRARFEGNPRGYFRGLRGKQ